ncbi:MAG: nitroreductase family protein [Candidatus Adiutrix sp.]|jgi:nitroreductase|nr:nitroreductase family protein [Candidatus Adiutrix sp.]
MRLLTLALGLALGFLAAPAQANDFNAIKLVQPDFNARGLTVIQALSARKSDRAFADRELSLTHLSETLWAAGGINRPDGHRTAPTANNRQAIEIFAITKDGTYRYDPPSHELRPLTPGDHRAAAGSQSFVATAPLNLIYAADLGQYKGNDTERKTVAGLDLGHFSENVYLYCASAGLSVVTRISIDPKILAPLLKLDAGLVPLMGQTVGYPQ